MLTQHLLSLAIWLPIVGAVVVLATGGDARAALARRISLVVSILTLLVTIPLYTGFNVQTAAMQFVEGPYVWVAAFNIHYHLGVDGISLLLILLTSFTTVLVVIAGWQVIQDRVAQYYAAFLIMEGLMIGVFSALDAVLFYVFWEAMLIPMFIIIGMWGGPNRVYATIKFFLYTLLGSVLMLVAFLYLYHHAGKTFDIRAFYDVRLGLTEQILIFVAFFAAFAVKVPMFPVHTWLPDAHVEAPTGGSVVLAAIMLKMGAYGFLRFSLPILPDASHELAGFMIALSLIAVVYIGLVALVQEDMKKLIAYSSIAHMGFVTLGFFVFNAQGMEGGLIQMISHGFVSGALFLCVGVMYDRLHSRMIKDYGGVVNRMPVFAAFMMLFAMANVGLPGTSGFVGEFLVILGSYQTSFWIAFLAATTLIFGAAYTLWMYKRVIFGAVAGDKVDKLEDINGREVLFLSLLAAAVLVMGLWPAPFLDVMHVSVDELLRLATTSKLSVAATAAVAP
jgi:NADH-quinone oxidoreductase subunit M